MTEQSFPPARSVGASPFDPTPPSGAGRILRWAVIVIALAAAVGVTGRFTR